MISILSILKYVILLLFNSYLTVDYLLLARENSFLEKARGSRVK